MLFPIFSIETISVFLILFARVIGIFTTAPVFGTRTIPIQIKVAISLVLAYISFQFFSATVYPLVEKGSFIMIFILILTEAIIGILIGFIGFVVFGVIQFAGRMIDISMGMHIASVMNPMTRERQSLIGQFQYIFAMLIFLFLNGHHQIIIATLQSYKLVPVGTLAFTKAFSLTFVTMINDSFFIAIRLAAPVVGILFLVDFSLGIIAKGVPQMNVFLTGMPIKALTGLLILFATFTYFSSYFMNIPSYTIQNIILILKTL